MLLVSVVVVVIRLGGTIIRLELVQNRSEGVLICMKGTIIYINGAKFVRMAGKFIRTTWKSARMLLDIGTRHNRIWRAGRVRCLD